MPQTELRQTQVSIDYLTDQFNAEAFVRDHEGDVRFMFPWRRWLVWNGHQWELDVDGTTMRLAKETVRRLSALIPTIDDEDERLKFVRHVLYSFSARGLSAMLTLARSEPGVPILPEHLDADPWLLNCQNGTLNLKTGELYAHRREDLITKMAPTSYDPHAPCTTWKTFLAMIMDGNQELIDFLQRIIGYALTGDVREQAMFIFHGSGANGKSTLLNTLMTMLGNYAMKAPSELLLSSKRDRHPTERADLCGRRFVAAIETEEDRRLAEVLVKEATGGDAMRARKMRQDFWEFLPTHKIFLATNHKPRVQGTDHAIWRRLKLIPFATRIPDALQDKDLPQKLKVELPGILAWAVRGCHMWQEQGLFVPACVHQATESYRQEMDTLGDYFTDCCEVNPRHQSTSLQLYGAFEAWCHDNGVHILSKDRFGKELARRGFTAVRIGPKQVRGWQGLRLKPDTLDR